MYVRLGLAVVGASLIVSAVHQARGQEKASAAPSKQAATKKAPAGRDPVAQFEQQFVEWKRLIAEARKTALEYKAATAQNKEAVLERYKETILRGETLEKKIHKTAEAAYRLAPNKNKDVTDFVYTMAVDAEKSDRYEDAVRLANLLIDNGFGDKAVYAVAGRSAFNANDFDMAAKDLQLAKDADVLEESPGQSLLAMLPEYQKKWEHEQEIRAAEEKADDLPRVKLKTSKGDIVLELFENEAPNTVANFISLVDKGFYNGLSFHRVIRGFVAQGGDPKGDGMGGPGYLIPCECYKDNHRLHFRGSLSMAHAGKDTGGSQFFLTLVPTAHLDGRHTVFGRVIEGMDVLSALQPRDPSQPNQFDPDKILEATVVRKRHHAYEPATLPEK
jgi:cyclophilin family peptidyl-prolyl cis-trans isomerase